MFKAYNDGKHLTIGNTTLPVRTVTEATKHLIPHKRDYVLENPFIDTVLDSVVCHENILIVGEPGCGKSDFVLWLAAELNIPLIMIQGDGEMSSTDLVGGFQYSDGATRWEEGLISFALKNGCWILFDEINMVLPEILSRLHSMLDDRKQLDLREINQVVGVSDRTIVFSTMNEGDTGRHSGLKPLSPALRSRFQCKVKFEYLSAQAEIDLLMSRTDVDKPTATNLVVVANTIRKAWRKKEIDDPIDLRALLACAHKIKRGFSLEHAMVPTILNDMTEGSIQAVRAVLLAHGMIQLETK